MSNYHPPAWIARQRLWSSGNTSADLSSTNSSLVGLYYMKQNKAESNAPPHLSPSSKSLQIRRLDNNLRLNANTQTLQTTKQRSHHRSNMLLRKASIGNNGVETDDGSMTGNPRSPSSSPTKISDDICLQRPQEGERNGKEQDLRHDYAKQSETSNLSKERLPQNERTLKHQAVAQGQLPSEQDLNLTVRPQRIRRSISAPQMEKPKILSNGRHDLRNLVVVTRTTKPIVHDHQAQASSEDEAVCSGIENLPSSSDDSISYVSSLSDDSYYNFSELESLVRNPPPLRMSNSHNMNTKINREGEVVRSGDSPQDVKSPSRKASSETKRRDGVPHQLIFATPGTNDSAVDEKNCTTFVAKNEGENAQNRKSQDFKRRRHRRQRSGTRSVEPTRPPPCNQRAISFSTAPTIQNRYATKSQHYKSKKLMSRNLSSLQLPSLDKPNFMHQRSMSTSAASLTNTTWSSTQHGSHWQNSCPANDNDSFVLNGRVVNRAKRRQNIADSFPPVVSGSRNIQDDQPASGCNVNSVYEAVMMGKLSRLELSTSLDSQSANAPSSSESSRYNLKNSLSSVDGVTSKNSIGITDSSVNGIVSTSSAMLGEGKRRRRRRSKDELKYFVGKLLPKPIRQIKAVLTRSKTCDLNRSRHGFLT